MVDLPGGDEKEHHRHRGLPALGHRAAPAAGDPRARRGRNVRRFQERSWATGRDPERVELNQELSRTNKALRELAIENTLLRGKADGV